MRWFVYNQNLVRRGELLLAFDVIDNWDSELKQVNKDKTKNEEQNSKLLDITIKKAKRLKKLTEDILDVTKIEDNTLPK